MFPPLEPSGVLPPYTPGAQPTDSLNISPYSTTLLEIAAYFGTTQPRIDLIRGLVDYRSAMRKLGFQVFYQWIDGSFTEDVETLRGRPPGDIDIVTFGFFPQNTTAHDKPAIMAANPDLFVPSASKLKYKCDAYFIDLGTFPLFVAEQTYFYHQLFSHQRITGRWKGMLKIPFLDDDILVTNHLNSQSTI